LSRTGYDRVASWNERLGIVRSLIDALNEMLRDLAANVPYVFHADLRGTLGPGDWANELHPNPAGFRLVAAKVEEAIRKAVP
jgi:hypothetical protein